MANPGLFSFSGRINRGTYWAITIGLLVSVAVAGIVAAIAIPKFAATETRPIGTGPAGVVFWVILGAMYISVFWVSFATAAKRWHDLDKSGWMALLNLIPVVGLITFIYLGVAAGTPGENRFGAATVQAT